MTRVLILGGSGMLGGMLADCLSRADGLSLTATVRTPELVRLCAGRIPDIEWRVAAAAGPLEEVLSGASWVINAVGIIKPYIRDDRADEVERAVRINSLFPHSLARDAERAGARVIQIATDCVYSGRTGGYAEAAPHDALDAYGKTKSLGEVRSPAVHHLRCSIIGPEPKGCRSLLEWFLARPRGAAVSGYTNHRWNGLTTLHFARVVLGVIRGDIALPHLHHLVPADAMTKAELLACFARALQRPDITIRPEPAPEAVDRTLRTDSPDLNRALWAGAGYSDPPAVARMADELAGWDFRLRGIEPRGAP